MIPCSVYGVTVGGCLKHKAFMVPSGPITHEGGGRFYKTCYEGLLFVTRDVNKPR